MKSDGREAGMRIGDLAASAGVGVETVRYYQRRGLLPEPPRAAGSRRYLGADVDRLRFVRRAQAAGFTLAEIGELIGLDATHDRARVRAIAETRIAALDARIEELAAVRAVLSTLAEDCANGAAGACPILTRFDAKASPGKRCDT